MWNVKRRGTSESAAIPHGHREAATAFTYERADNEPYRSDHAAAQQGEISYQLAILGVMLRTIRRVGFTASALAILPLPTAHADIVNLPPHEKTFESEVGNFTVGTRDEVINRIPPLNGVRTSYEALVSNVAYARIDGQAEGTLKTGYYVGCAAKLDVVTPGIAPSLEFGIEGPQQNYLTEQAQTYTTEQAQAQTSEQARSRTVEQTGTGDPTRSRTQEFGQSRTREFGQSQEFESGQAQEFNGITPSVTVDPGPNLEFDIKAGDIVTVEIGKGKALIPGKTVQIVTRDFYIKVDGCIGPVTVRQYSSVEARTPEVDDSGAVFGDPTGL
ncbi:MspA family porin [Nocardia arizonensis]|uniref:MspA family porin n=1 Tax=Nocardia arizonensis TaxID=1141647 RepID=UPI00138F22FE|nr:MspA family porin [Nocardia arizonensis]